MPTPTATIFLPYSALDDVVLRGTRAAQPAATAVTPGTLYGVTDEANTLERSNGTAWELYAPTGGGGGAPAPHHLTHETGGTDAIAALSGAVITTGTVAAARLGAHHATHETGGSDAIAALDAGVLTTGTVAPARLPATMPPTAHHLTHETGGTDAIAALSGAVITSGTVLDARLSSNIPRLNVANLFATKNTFPDLAISASGNPRLALTDVSQPADARVFEARNAGGHVHLDAVNDAQSAVVQAGLDLDRSGNLRVGQDLYEKGRTTPLGHWIDIPWSSGIFTGVNSGGVPTGTWVVDAGDLQQLAYTVIGKTMTVGFYLTTTTVTGGPAALQIALPAPSVAATGMGGVFMYNEAASNQVGSCVLSGTGALKLQKDVFGTAWGGTANSTYLWGVVTFRLA